MDYYSMKRDPRWLSGYDERLRDMKYTVINLEVMGLNPGWIELWVRSLSI